MIDKAIVELTINELDLINRALTGYEKRLADLIESTNELGFTADEEEEILEKVKKLDKKIRDIAWDAKFAKYR